MFQWFWSSVVLTGNPAPGARSRYGGNCIDPYAFKDYGGYAYELMSMGLETLYRRPSAYLRGPGTLRWVPEMVERFGGRHEAGRPCGVPCW